MYLNKRKNRDRLLKFKTTLSYTYYLTLFTK